MLVVVDSHSKTDITIWYTVEPLNKGHLPTVGTVPYSEVVLYCGVLQKQSTIMMSNDQNLRIYQQCFYAVAALFNMKLWHACNLNNHGSKEKLA